VDTFERVHSGELSLDPTVDVFPGAGLTVERIRKQLTCRPGRDRTAGCAGIAHSPCSSQHRLEALAD
jgi:hypothetical protein